MKACPVGLAGLVVAARGPGASFLRRSFDECRRMHGTGASAAARGQDRLDGILPGLPRRCAARSAEAAHAAATPPRALETSRRGSRGAAGLFGIACGTDLDACRSLRGTRICALSVDTRASVLVEKSTVMRIATVMISYRVRCSDEYDTLAQDLIRNKYAAKQPSQDR